MNGNGKVLKGKKTVGGVEVRTKEKAIFGACMMKVEAGTTGYMGGDTGHGGRTYFSIRNLSSVDIEVRQIGSRGCDGFELAFGGDEELREFIIALEFAARTLKQQIKESER